MNKEINKFFSGVWLKHKKILAQVDRSNALVESTQPPFASLKERNRDKIGGNI
jgi:hypothetical protein